jgi:hypothetical protein
VGKYANLSKFFYDIAKLTFGGFVIGSVISKEMINILLTIIGLLIIMLF